MTSLSRSDQRNLFGRFLCKVPSLFNCF